MFGKPAQGSNNGATPQRRAASDVARIEGGGLVQVIVTSLSPMTYYLFLNDQAVSQIDIESLSLDIETPDISGTGSPIVRATLSRYVTSVDGQKTAQRTEIFPSTLEIVALGRRISVTCSRADSLDGLWINLGLKPDGSSGDVEGAAALRILLTEGILDAKLTWNDGETEDLLPQ